MSWPFPSEQVEVLSVALADGNDHATAFFELFNQLGRNIFRGAGDDDLVERRIFRPAEVTVADFRFHVRVSGQDSGGPLAERLDDLDRVDLLDKVAENGGLVSAARTDLQHLVVRLGIESLGHVGHDEGGRDGLGLADGQSHIPVVHLKACRPVTRRNVFVARHGSHRLDHARILHSGRHDFFIDHAVARRFDQMG